MIDDFAYRCPTRLLFGSGKIDVAGAEAAALGIQRVLIICGTGHTARSEGLERLRASLHGAGLASECFARVTHDPSSEMVAEAASALIAGHFDGVIAFGGGSPIDCAKSAALFAANALADGTPEPGSSPLDFVYGRRIYRRPGFPLIAIPTTAGSGSEMSAAAVTTDLSAGKKLGLSSDFFFPRLAIVDPELHISLPPALTAATGMDALTHAIESFVSLAASALSRCIAAESARLLFSSLGKAYVDGSDLGARSEAALGSAIVGIAFSQTGLGMVHGFGHPVGARAGLAHGLANAILLPHVMEASCETVPGPYAELARAIDPSLARLGDSEAAFALVRMVRELSESLAIPARLSAAGVRRQDFDAILEDAKTYRSRKSIPRSFSDAELEAVLEKAF